MHRANLLNINLDHVNVFNPFYQMTGFPGDSVVKNLPAKAGDTGDTVLIPGSGRSPGGGNGKPRQYSCMKTSVDRGA